mgnify:CR=1 FL=1
MNTLYDRDFYGWCLEQAWNLENGNVEKLDLKNLIEEIASMGRSEKNELINRLAVLLCHILKWEYQPHLRSHSWKFTILEQTERVKDLLLENPSLKTPERYDQCLSKAYSYGAKQACEQTGLPLGTFPPTFPFSDPLNFNIPGEPCDI